MPQSSVIILRGPVDTLAGHSVAFVVAVGDIEIDPGGKTSDERIDQGHGSSTVHIVIPVHQNLLRVLDGPAEPRHGGVHILHQERVVKVVKAGTEKAPGLLKSLHTPPYQKSGEHFVDAHLRGKGVDLFRISFFLQNPFVFLGHIHTKLGNIFQFRDKNLTFAILPK